MAEAWTSDEVISWLNENKLKYWAKEFEAVRDDGMEIDGITLLQVDETSLQEDFPSSRNLARKQLVAKVKKLEADIGMPAPPKLHRKGTHVEVKIPKTMMDLERQPSLAPLYREMSVAELKKIAPDCISAYSDAFKKSHSELFEEKDADETGIGSPAEPEKKPAGPADPDKIKKLQKMMSVRVNMQDPRTAVHFQMLPPNYNLEVLNRMSTERSGDELDSAQTILGLHTVLRPKEYYRFDSARGVTKVSKPRDPSVEVKEMKRCVGNVKIPHVKIDGTWIGDLLDDDANLLGGSHKFEVDKIPVDLPIVDASEDVLAHFGCKLIRHNDIVTFPELRRPFPVFCLQIGESYMKDYIMVRELGGGVFLEYHDDNPHFHSPLSRKSGGYLLLGVPCEGRTWGNNPLPKRPDPTQFVSLKVAGIRVPHGCAVYTPPGVLHADSACTGRWLIGYDQSADFSTVLFRTKSDEVAPMNELRISM